MAQIAQRQLLAQEVHGLNTFRHFVTKSTSLLIVTAFISKREKYAKKSPLRGSQVVTVLAFYSNNSNPAEAFSCFYKI